MIDQNTLMRAFGNLSCVITEHASNRRIIRFRGGSKPYGEIGDRDELDYRTFDLDICQTDEFLATWQIKCQQPRLGIISMAWPGHRFSIAKKDTPTGSQYCIRTGRAETLVEARLRGWL